MMRLFSNLRPLIWILCGSLTLASCVHTRVVTSIDAVLQKEINETRADDWALVSTDSLPSISLAARHLELSMDTLVWYSNKLERRSTAVRDLNQIEYVYHGRGALEGLGLGALGGCALGVLIGLTTKDDPPGVWFPLTRQEKAFVAAGVLSLLGAGLGAITGALIGSHDRLELRIR